ncbi:MAG: hypothetical protein MUE35_12690 [Hydrogenophaga sp.]|nr:hypothetical protein [Hydrogenophaga sp.]
MIPSIRPPASVLTRARSCRRRAASLFLLAPLALAPWVVHAQVTTFDFATGRVAIPSVQVGAHTYTQVALQLRGDRFELAAASGPAPVAFPAVGTYDPARGTLSLPAVRVGPDTFFDVTLRDLGNLSFGLTGVRAMPPGLMGEIEAAARGIEGLTATAVPATGAQRLALADGCWLNNGRNRAEFIAEYDAELAEVLVRDAYLVGRRIEAIQPLALRETVLADGSTRREVDVQWDIVYRDGTRLVGEKNTLVSGNSAGTPGCTTPQTGSSLRVLGNQRLARVELRANNLREARYALSNGAALSPTVRERREVEFYISDPGARFTYAIVQGPGPSNSIGGTTYPFSMKFISPRLLRDAPELRGKPGNFVNWADDDPFRNCFFSNNTPPIAQFVDCVASGANSSSWGFGYTGTPDAAADASFEAQGWVAGGMYRFDLYNDDGWNTVNGHAGRTPVATLYAELSRLPYRFTEMAGRYPVPTLTGTTPAQVAANIASANPVPVGLQWNTPTWVGAPMQFSQAWEFHQGPRTGNAEGVYNPAVRSLVRVYPGSTATSASVPISRLPADQARKTYTELLLFYVEPGTVHSVRSRLTFQ